MLRSSLLFLLLALSATASAEEFDYNWLGFGYGTIDFDDANVDGNALGIDGSFAFHPDFHAFASYAAADLDFGFDSTSFDLGVGYNTSLSDVVDAYARLSFEYLEFEGPGGGSNDDNGYGFAVGMRFAATEQLELEGAIEYVDFSDFGDDTALVLGGLYSFTPQFAVGLFGEWGDDVSSYTLLGRFYWGQ
jgi:opacity protein-like surface antigen